MMTTLSELAALFKVLSHPQRLTILQLLKGRELCVCEIEAALDLRQAYISQQLMLLREAGLVCFRKEGWNVWYRIAQPEVYALLAAAESIHDRLGTCAVAPEACISNADACRRMSRKELLFHEQTASL